MLLFFVNQSITSLHVDTNVRIGDKSRRDGEIEQRNHRYRRVNQTVGKIFVF